jgi:hypothetical protein
MKIEIRKKRHVILVNTFMTLVIYEYFGAEGTGAADTKY